MNYVYNEEGNQNNKNLEIDLNITKIVNQTNFNERDNGIIKYITESYDFFNEKIKDARYKKKFLENIDDSNTTMVEKMLKNSTMVPQTIIAEQPLMTTNVESGNIQELETVTATDLDQEIDTKKQIEQQAENYKIDVVKKFNVLEQFAERNGITYDQALNFIMNKWDKLEIEKKNEVALLALQNNPNLLVFGHQQITFESMIHNPDKNVIKSLGNEKNFLDNVFRMRLSGVTTTAVLSNITSQAISGLNAKLAYIKSDVTNLLSDSKNGKEFNINDYPVLAHLYPEIKSSSEIISTAIKDIKELESKRDEVQTLMKELNDLSKIVDYQIKPESNFVSYYGTPTYKEKEQQVKSILTRLFDALIFIFNTLLKEQNYYDSGPYQSHYEPPKENTQEKKYDSPEQMEEDQIALAKEEALKKQQEEDEAIEITGSGIKNIEEKENNYHISAHKKPELNEFASVTRIIKELSRPVGKMKPYKHFTRNKNNKLADHVIENIPQQVSPIINPKTVGCGRCGSLNSLHVHDKNPDDITCQNCLGKGITSKRHIAKDVNLEPIENSKNEKHIEILKNNDMQKSIEKLKMNQNETLWEKFKKSVPIKINFINRYSKMNVPKKNMSEYDLDKLVVLLGKYQHDYENMSKQLLLNMEHMIAEYINNNNVKKNYAPIDSKKFEDFETLKKYFISSPNSFLSILTDI
jgi:hypothetical protein